MWIKGFGNLQDLLYFAALIFHTMLPHTQHSLDKLESLLNDLGYKVRYEKGNFKTGACLLQTNKIVVVNRFSNLEMKIGALIGLLQGINTESNTLSDKQKQFLRSIKQTKLTI